MQRFFQCFLSTPPIGVKGDYRCSVHFGNTYRLDKAREQASFSPVDVNVITAYVNDFFRSIGMNTVESPVINNPLQIVYEKIKRDNELGELVFIVKY